MAYIQPVFVTARRDNSKCAKLHRDGVVAIDKLALPTISTAKNDNIVGVMAASASHCMVAAGNRYGSTLPTADAAVTPTSNKTVDITVSKVTNAEWYDVFFSTDAAPLYLGRVTEAMRANGCAITAVGTAAAVYQVETATAAGTVSGTGTGKAIVTAAGMTGSAKTITFPVTIGDVAATWATACRTALSADAAVSAMFTVGGSDASIILTKKVGAANDATLNIALDNDSSTGITTASTSANTTWGIDPGVINVRLVGTGVASTADPFKFNNSYTPAAVTSIDCDGKTTAHVYVTVAVTDLRSAPTLSVVPFTKNYTTGDFAQGALQAVTLLTALGKPLMQTFDVDVTGASGLVVLIDAISGQGTAATIHIELN